MSMHERNRYVTTALVFLAAFVVLGLLFLRSVRSMAAPDFIWRPMLSFVNNDSVSAASTAYAALAKDDNRNTAAKTYVNADFTGEAPPAADFTWSAKWSTFEQTARNLDVVNIYILRSTTGSSTDLWEYEYSNDSGGSWNPIESGGDSTSLDTVSASVAGDTTEIDETLLVQVSTRRMDTNELDLSTFDIHVEAERDESAGGSCELKINTPATLPFALVIEPCAEGLCYDEIIDAGCGLPGTGYSWEGESTLPDWLTGERIEPGDADFADYPYDYRVFNKAGRPNSDSFDIGTHTFTLKVTDSSTYQQSFTRQFSVTVTGLAIDPPGPDLPLATKGQNYLTDDDPPDHHKFTPVGVDGTASWCLVSGSPPPGMNLVYTLAHLDLPRCSTASTVYASAISLVGAPTDDGVYEFIIRLVDTDAGEITETTIHDYLLNVQSSGVTILDRILKPMVKGIRYSNSTAWTYPPMEAQSLMAVRATKSIYNTTIQWTASGLPAALGLADTTLSTAAAISRAYIVGTIGVTAFSGNHTFTATIDDNSLDADSRDFVLKVLERETKLLKAPPSTVKLPSSSKLFFVVTGKGGGSEQYGRYTKGWHIGTLLQLYLDSNAGRCDEFAGTGYPKRYNRPRHQ